MIANSLKKYTKLVFTEKNSNEFESIYQSNIVIKVNNKHANIINLFNDHFESKIIIFNNSVDLENIKKLAEIGIIHFDCELLINIIKEDFLSNNIDCSFESNKIIN